MKTLQEFKDFLAIDFIDEKQAYGHFPFQMVSKDQNDNYVITAICVAHVVHCYRKFHDTMKSGAKKVYMSIDFPAMEDIKHDFVAVFSYDGEAEESDMGLIALPYNTETGERYSEIDKADSPILREILKQFCSIALKSAGIL